jgi:drug/metabolite transporter (DMT)-like permease
MKEGAGRAEAALAALVGAGLIGLSPIAIRLSEVGPQATNFWRFVLALPILAVWAAVSGPRPGGRQLAMLLGGGVLFGIEVSLWGAAVVLTTVTNATLLANLTPVFAALFGWMLLRERLSRPIAAGIAVALAGAAILAFSRAQGGGGVRASAHGLLGDALGFSAAIGYAGYLLVVRALGRSVGVGAVMFWATASSAVVLLIASLATHEALLARTPTGWALLIGLGVVVQVAGQGLIAVGVGRLPIAISTVLLWMQPLVAAILSWIMFDEELSPLALGGAALILAGIYVVQRARS